MENKNKKEQKEPEILENENTEQQTENIQDYQEKDLAKEYLNLAKIIQADFDNYRKRTSETIRQAKEDGIISAIEIILPSLDVFKKAKELITDKDALKGIEMVENGIFSSLKTLGVEKINTENQIFNPKYHCALAVIQDKEKPDGYIKEEFQSGYIYGEKVIRYSQVLVNRIKEDK